MCGIKPSTIFQKLKKKKRTTIHIYNNNNRGLQRDCKVFFKSLVIDISYITKERLISGSWALPQQLFDEISHP